MSKATNPEPKVAQSSKLNSCVVLLYEKLTRENNITLEQVRAATILIKDGEVTVRMKG